MRCVLGESFSEQNGMLLSSMCSDISAVLNVTPLLPFYKRHPTSQAIADVQNNEREQESERESERKNGNRPACILVCILSFSPSVGRSNFGCLSAELARSSQLPILGS